MNIVTSVVENEEKLNEEVEKIVMEILEGGPQIQQKIKELVNVVDSKTSEESLDHVKKLFQYMITSPEARYGMKCFMEKKKPDWKNAKL